MGEGVIQPCCTHTGGRQLQLPPSPLLPQALRARVRAHAHSPFLYFIMFPLSLCTHILCEAVKNRDEKNRMRGDMNCTLVLSTQKTKCMFKKDNIFVFIITVKILGQQIAFCNLCCWTACCIWILEFLFNSSLFSVVFLLFTLFIMSSRIEMSSLKTCFSSCCQLKKYINTSWIPRSSHVRAQSGTHLVHLNCFSPVLVL